MPKDSKVGITDVNFGGYEKNQYDDNEFSVLSKHRRCIGSHNFGVTTGRKKPFFSNYNDKPVDNIYDKNYKETDKKNTMLVNYRQMPGRKYIEKNDYPAKNNNYYPNYEFAMKRTSQTIDIEKVSSRKQGMLRERTLISCENDLQYCPDNTRSTLPFNEKRRSVSPRRYQTLPSFNKMEGRKRMPSHIAPLGNYLAMNPSTLNPNYKLKSPNVSVINIKRNTSRKQKPFWTNTKPSKDISYNPSFKLQDRHIPKCDVFLKEGRGLNVKNLCESVDVLLNRVSSSLRGKGLSLDDEQQLELEWERMQEENGVDLLSWDNNTQSVKKKKKKFVKPVVDSM